MSSGKKTKQQLLQESEERFRVMFEDHGAAMLLIEPDSGQITDANEAAAQFYGYSREQLRAMCIDQINQLRPEEVADDCRKAVRRVKNEFVFPHRLASGDVRFVEVYSSPVTIQGRPMLFSIIHDITDRNRSEQALRASEERFRALVQASSDAVYRMSPDWTEMHHLVGRDFIADTQEPSQTWLQNYIHPDDRPRVMAAIKEAIRTKSVFESTHRVLRADGSLGWTFSRAIPIFDVRGEITEWFGMARDITERRHREEALKESTKRLTTIFQMSPVGIFFSRSSDAKFIDVNEAFLETTGYAREQVLGRTPSELGLWVAPQDRERFGKSLADQGRIDGIELKHRRKNGDIIDVQIILLPLDLEEEPCFIGTLTDVTARKRAEEEIIKSHDELELRVKQRTSELSDAVQRLRSEIVQRRRLEETLREAENQVRFFASQCLSAQEIERKRIAGELHDSIAASLSAIKFSIESTAEAMKQGRASAETLLDLGSRVAEVTGEVRRIMADLRPSILDDLGIIPAVNWFCREYQKTYSHIRLEKQAEIAEAEVPDALKTPIFRIVQEAMNNIAKHSKASFLNLSLRKEDGKILLTIQDDGRGFDLATVRKGMGLSTMMERAELSGGVFSLDTAAGRGTTLRVAWRP